MSCHRMWLPGTGNAGFETRDRAPQKTVVVCHDSPLCLLTLVRSRVRCHTGNLSVYARHSPLVFSSGRDFGRKAWRLGDFLVDVESAICCCAQSLRRQGRWDGCATLASSQPAACQSSDRLRALAMKFVSILVALPHPNVSGMLWGFSRLVRVKFLQDVLLGGIQRPLPTTSNKTGHLKKHRTLCLVSLIPCHRPPVQQLGPCLAGYPGIPDPLVMESKLWGMAPFFCCTHNSSPDSCRLSPD